MESVEYYDRALINPLLEALSRGKNVLLLGPRQTGKTTLLSRVPNDLSLSFIQPALRQAYEKDTSLLEREIKGLPTRAGHRPRIILDEIQKVPEITDAVQDLIDRKVAQFILTGSSARKLRRNGATNLLPGRVLPFRLDPLSLEERRPGSIEEALMFGSLPGIIAQENDSFREQELDGYVTTYLEEEVRSEALVRNLAHFSRFLELAASESGRVVNLRKLSQEIGVAHTTIAAYHQILEDCLIAERVEPISESQTRRKLTRGERYLFFDMGVRRRAAQEGLAPPLERWGELFEHWVGLELIRAMRAKNPPHCSLRFWRDPDGPEVNWVVQRNKTFIPIETKWTSRPSPRDAHHLEIFLDEYPSSSHGYVLCRAPRPQALSPRVTALPWQDLPQILEER